MIVKLFGQEVESCGATDPNVIGMAVDIGDGRIIRTPIEGARPFIKLTSNEELSADDLDHLKMVGVEMRKPTGSELDKWANEQMAKGVAVSEIERALPTRRSQQPTKPVKITAHFRPVRRH